MSNQLDVVGYATKFFANEAGRDKFNKAIQYGARLAAHEIKLQDPNSDLPKRLLGLSVQVAEARRLLRWFKQFTEIQKINNLLKQPTSLTQQLKIVGASGLFTYWTFDNLVFLSKAKVIEANPEWVKISMLGWWVGLSTSIIVDAIALRDNISKEAKLRSNLATLSKGSDDSKTQKDANETKQRTEKELSTLLTQRTTLILSLVTNIGDWIVASNGWQMSSYIGTKPFSERTASFGGLVGAVITCYQVFKAL